LNFEQVKYDNYTVVSIRDVISRLFNKKTNILVVFFVE